MTVPLDFGEPAVGLKSVHWVMALGSTTSRSSLETASESPTLCPSQSWGL